jgi:hypothetical protein
VTRLSRSSTTSAGGSPPERIAVDLLYGDHLGSQRVISRFLLRPLEDGMWLATVGRRWNVDRSDPR